MKQLLEQLDKLILVNPEFIYLSHGEAAVQLAESLDQEVTEEIEQVIEENL